MNTKKAFINKFLEFTCLQKEIKIGYQRLLTKILNTLEKNILNQITFVNNSK